MQQASNLCAAGAQAVVVQVLEVEVVAHGQVEQCVAEEPGQRSSHTQGLCLRDRLGSFG